MNIKRKIAESLAEKVSRNHWKLYYHGGAVVIVNGIDCVHREVAKTEDEAIRRIISFLEGIKFCQQAKYLNTGE